MVFSSFVFLLAFLLLVLLIYYVCPGKVRNLVLLVASLLFYAWGEPVYVLIMLFSTVFDYTNGRLIEYFQNKNRPGKAKVVLVIDLVGNLGILGFFKYADFVIGNINSITGAGLTLLHIALPIGISFYTFQTMSYTIDVYRKVVPAQHNIVAFATYVTLFPQLIAGPIVQYKTVAAELSDRKVTLTDFSEGAFRFTIGLAKKVLLANQIGSLWDTISQLQQMSAATAWLGAIAYSFQIYFDFSGYSDMAIGLGKMFGFHFLENFNFPYMSKTITEFWRRWHISLSSWFKEYVYIPLGGNRKGKIRKYLNLLITFSISGLWHGGSVKFLFWGLLHAIYQVVGSLTVKNRDRIYLILGMNEHSRFKHFLRVLGTSFFIMLGWIVFRADRLQTGLSMIGSIFTDFNPWIFSGTYLFNLGLGQNEWIVLLLSILLLCFVSRKQERRVDVGSDISSANIIARYTFYIATIVTILIFGTYGYGFDSQDFIYGGF